MTCHYCKGTRGYLVQLSERKTLSSLSYVMVSSGSHGGGVDMACVSYVMCMSSAGIS